MAKALEPFERKAAAERMAVRSEKFTEVKPQEKGQSRDKVADSVGMSAPTLAKATAVVEAAEAHPEHYKDIAEEVDRTGKVDPAYKPDFRCGRRGPLIRFTSHRSLQTEGIPMRGITLALIAVGCIASRARAATFDVPAEKASVQTLPGSIRNVVGFKNWVVGSDQATGKAAGQLQADLSDAGIHFSTGSTLTFQNQPGVHSPGVGGVNGSAPAAFSYFTYAPISNDAHGYLAVRNLSFGIMGDATFPAGSHSATVPLSESGVRLFVASGELDYRLFSSGAEMFPLAAGSSNLAPGAAFTEATLHVEDGPLPGTRVLAIDFTMTIETGVTVGVARLNFQGSFQSDPAVVPEPSSLGLLLVGGMTLPRRRRR